MPAPLAEMRKHRGSSFLNRAPGDIDQRPVVPGAKPPRCGDFLSNRLAVDILIVVTVHFKSKEPVLPNLHDPFRRGVKPNHQRALERF